MSERVAGRICSVWGENDADWLILQPLDKRDIDSAVQPEGTYIRQHSRQKCRLVGFAVEDWNAELSPWSAPPVWGKADFAGQAEKTLAWLTDELLPRIRRDLSPDVRVMLGGYSLAGLFALWAAGETDGLDAVAAASPSVWYPGYMVHEAQKPIRAGHVYLSLGDREEKTKNRTMAAVGACIRELDARLEARGVRHILEWNEGNHFCQPDIRVAKGFCWGMGNAGLPTRETRIETQAFLAISDFRHTEIPHSGRVTPIPDLPEGFQSGKLV